MRHGINPDVDKAKQKHTSVPDPCQFSTSNAHRVEQWQRRSVLGTAEGEWINTDHRSSFTNLKHRHSRMGLNTAAILRFQSKK